MHNVTALIHELITGEEYKISAGEKAAAPQPNPATSALLNLESATPQTAAQSITSKSSRKQQPSIDGIRFRRSIYSNILFIFSPDLYTWRRFHDVPVANRRCIGSCPKA